MEEAKRLATPMSEPFLIYGTKSLLGERDAWLAALADERQACLLKIERCLVVGAE